LIGERGPLHPFLGFLDRVNHDGKRLERRALLDLQEAARRGLDEAGRAQGVGGLGREGDGLAAFSGQPRSQRVGVR
jgi:hypothetical protein